MKILSRWTTAATRHAKARRRGFSLTELIVAAGLAAAVFTTGALAYRTVTVHQKRTTNYQNLKLGPAITKAFFDDGTGSFDVFTSPNYGIAARAEVLRSIFWDDVAHATAVFCLPRPEIPVNVASAATDKVAGINYVHPPIQSFAPPPSSPTGTPNELNATVPFTGVGMMLDHPNAFLNVLASYAPDSTTNPFPFQGQSFRGVPAAGSVNASIYVLQATGQANQLAIRAIYDIDFLSVTEAQPGVYASVKRYVGTALTHYYDVLYPGVDQTPTQFGPVFACFERSVRTSVVEGNQTDAFKQATHRPFYMIWWPDPAQPRLSGNPTTTAYANTDPRKYYASHENQTSWMFTVPMFPSL
jgi:hypothetical protein